MACGLPVVATRVGGADELVEEGRTGLLIPPVAPHAMRDAILRVARDPQLRHEMGLAGRQRAQALFGLDRMMDEYLALYLGLLTNTERNGEIAS
jgi:glycosyltransferase involved in cell wall biosynthesis